MLNPDLLNYIRQQLQAGFSKASIYQALRVSNWPNDMIDQAFALIENKPLLVKQKADKKAQFWQWCQTNYLLFVFLFLLLLGFALFFQRQSRLSQDKKNSEALEIVIEMPEEEWESSPEAEIHEFNLLLTQSPQEAWLAMKAEFNNLESYDELETYNLKYGDEEMIVSWQAEREQVAKLPRIAKDQLVKLAQSFVPDEEITVIDESIEGDLAFLTVYTTDPKLTAKVQLVKQDGVWKLHQEEWVSEE